MRLALTVILAAQLLPLLPAQIRVTTVAQLQAALATAGPGSTIQLAPGTYTFPTLTLANRHGLPDRWITLRSERAAAPAVLRGDGSQIQVLEIADCSYLRFEDLEFTAAPRTTGPRVHGIRYPPGTTSSNLVFDHCHFHDLSGNGMDSLATLLADLSVTTCIFARCGESGLTLGTFPGGGGGIVSGLLVQACWFTQTGLAPSQPFAFGIHLKPGSHGCRIEENVLQDVGTSQGAAIACYWVDPAGGQPAARWNRIARNLIQDGRPAATRVYEGVFTVNSTVVENNLILGVRRGIGVQVRSNATALDNLYFRNNTIYQCAEAGIALHDSGAMVAPNVIANNVVSRTATGVPAYDAVPPLATGSVTLAANGYGGGNGGFGSLPLGAAAVEFQNPALLDLYPAAGSGLIDAGAPAHAPTDDFNGLRRVGTIAPDLGAYERTQPANPGWLPGPGFKDRALPLWPPFATFAAGTGGRVDFALRADASAGSLVFLLVSATGPDAAGPLPVVLDAFTWWAVTPGSFPICQGYGNVVPATGAVAMRLQVPPVSLPSGLSLYHAAAVLTPTGTWLSNLARVRIDP